MFLETPFLINLEMAGSARLAGQRVSPEDPVSASSAQGLQTHATVPGFVFVVVLFLFFKHGL